MIPATHLATGGQMLRVLVLCCLLLPRVTASAAAQEVEAGAAADSVAALDLPVEVADAVIAARPRGPGRGLAQADLAMPV